MNSTDLTPNVDTDPAMPALGGAGKPCGVSGCQNEASPFIFCDACGIRLCTPHIRPISRHGRAFVTCPAHESRMRGDHGQ